MAANFRNGRSLAFTLTLALATGVTSALAAPSLMTPIIGSKNTRTQFDIKSAAMPIQLNRVALAKLQKQDEFDFVFPNGSSHTVIFDRIEDHGDGIHSSVGYLRDHGKDFRVIITSGPDGSFGSIRTPETLYRILPGANGQDLMIDMTEEQKLIPYIDLGNDARRVPEDPIAGLKDAGLRASLMRTSGQTTEPAIALSTPAPQAAVDLMIVYTDGFATQIGTPTQVMTRLNSLVTAANTAYIDSEVAITLRLVNTTRVAYTDAPGDEAALDAITPVAGGGVGVFASIESIRATNGADMVSFLRAGGANFGSGIAWITTSATPQASYMYSVVTGCVVGCDSVFIHELGHNMGNAHDLATASYQHGGTPTPPPGAFPYSFGHYYCASGLLNCDPTRTPANGGCTSQPVCTTSTANNIGTIMSYFNPVTLKFSNPALQCSRPGGVSQPCGTAQEDNARSMNGMRIALQNLKASVGATSSTLLVSPVNPSIIGQSITLTATVSGSVGTPTGTVTFRDAGNTIVNCSAVALVSGSASCVMSAPALGSHPITALYSGNTLYNISTSSTLTQIVNANSFLLTVARIGTGNGQITSSPAGIDTNIGSNSATYTSGTPITLTAAPQVGSSFASWNGGGCGVNPICTFNLNAITTITATFNIIQTAPGAPTIGTAIAGNAQALINFTPPASNGNAPIIDYTATCNPGGLPGTATASPVTVSGLGNGTTYTCTVVANNSVGPSGASASVGVTPLLAAPPALASVVSRKTHGSPTLFDLPINLTGPVSVEPRTIGNGHTIVFHFNNTIDNAGSVVIRDSGNNIVNATSTLTPTNTDVIVTIPSLADNKRVTITLTGVSGPSGAATTPPVSMGFLVGDFNNSRTVNAADISAVKAHSGQSATITNFKFDVNAAGGITSADVSAVKARAGVALP